VGSSGGEGAAARFGIVALVFLAGAIAGWLARGGVRPVVPAIDAGASPPSPSAALPPSPTVTAVARVDGGSRCTSGLRFESDRGCFRPSILVEPGKGIKGIVVGQSSPDDVLRVFGRDALVSKHKDGEVFQISYAYDANGQYDPGRAANHTRPSKMEAKRGRITRISVGVYQEDLHTTGGLFSGSTKAEMIATFGEPDAIVPGSAIDSYIYRRRGIELWVDREREEINSFHIRVPEEKEVTE
jgi:hypothetical protein